MSALSILVIRAEPGAAGSAARLRDRGYRPVVAPVQEVEPVEVSELELAPGELVVVSSPAGARRLGVLLKGRDCEIWCVGDSTAEQVKGFGFSQIYSAGGDSRSLERVLEQRRQGSSLLHLASEEAGRRFADRMEKKGFRARVVSVYRMRDCGIFLEEEDALSLRAVLVHSAGAAQSLSGQVCFGSSVCVVAISERAAEPLQGVLDRIFLASRPDEGSMLEALDGLQERGCLRESAR